MKDTKNLIFGVYNKTSADPMLVKVKKDININVMLNAMLILLTCMHDKMIEDKCDCGDCEEINKFVNTSLSFFGNAKVEKPEYVH